MNSHNHCTIRLLKKSYTLRCPSGEEARLQLAAKKINDLMQKNQTKFPALEAFQLLLLAALEVSHALIAQESAAENPQDMNDFIESLEARLQSIAELGKEHRSDSHE